MIVALAGLPGTGKSTLAAELLHRLAGQALLLDKDRVRHALFGPGHALISNSGRDRTSAFVYAVGWTHHTVGVQYIRTAAILQQLLGNIGRPGGGIMALRGHASIQGSTDIPTLFDLLPGYLPMPHAHDHLDLASYISADAGTKGYWGNMDAYTVSLLKAWWGEAAAPHNDFCFGYLPRLTSCHPNYDTIFKQLEGTSKGYFVVGENPAVGTANSKLNRMALANLEWLVIRDFSMIESATFWKDGPEIASGELRIEDIGTEIFFLPAAAHTEKSGPPHPTLVGACPARVDKPSMNSYFEGMKAVVSDKGQVTIPKPLRDRLGIRPGEVLEFAEEGGRLVAVKQRRRSPLDSVYGILQVAHPTDELITELRGPAELP